MKTARQIERLLQQGKKRRDLVDSGYTKAVVTRVARRLKKRRATEEVASRNRRAQNDRPVVSPFEASESVGAKPEKLEADIKSLVERVESLEKTSAGLKEIRQNVVGTPSLGLRQRFKCGCGESGLVAIRILCTKCGKETWWGWWPQRQ